MSVCDPLDVRCSEVSDKIVSKVIPWMNYFINRVFIKFGEYLAYRMGRHINNYYGLVSVKLLQVF